MSAALVNPRKDWTETELESLPEDGYIHEVVDGELVMSPKNNWFHGRICTRLIIAIGNFVRENRLGAVLDSSTGFWMFNRNCRAPDVSFVPTARLSTLGFKPSERCFFPGAPDLAIEILPMNLPVARCPLTLPSPPVGERVAEGQVRGWLRGSMREVLHRGILSPNNARAEIDARLKDFFQGGTQVAWVIDPEAETVEVCPSPTQRRLVGSGALLDGEHLLPGFHYPIANLFKDWDWE